MTYNPDRVLNSNSVYYNMDNVCLVVIHSTHVYFNIITVRICCLVLLLSIAVSVDVSIEIVCGSIDFILYGGQQALHIVALGVFDWSIS